MRYVTSDLHGCYDEFMLLLKKINFSSKDELFVIGDVVDRGENNIKLLQYIINADNINLIMGNHEYMMFECLIPPDYSPEEKFDLKNDSRFIENRISWINHHGGKNTALEYNKLTYKEQKDIYYYLQKLPLYKVLEVNEQKFLLIHGAPSKDFISNMKANNIKSDVLWTRIELSDFNLDLVPNYIVILGHTPTINYGDEYEDIIIKGKNKYLIDCGGTFGHSFACVCLENLNVTYVKRNET